MRYRLARMLLIAMGATTLFGRSSDFGSATGVVLDSAGKPLADATVYAYSEEDMFRQIRTRSDSAGRFRLESLPRGAEYVDAFKESDGYPYNFFSFFQTPGQRTPVKINVTAGKVTPNVILQMGLRAAYIELDIRDDDGTPVNGTLLFDRPDIPGPYSRGVAATELLEVPPVPFRLSFEARGYLPWHYEGKRGNTSAGLLALKSGETIRLRIRLKRSP